MAPQIAGLGHTAAARLGRILGEVGGSFRELGRNAIGADLHRERRAVMLDQTARAGRGDRADAKRVVLVRRREVAVHFEFCLHTRESEIVRKGGHGAGCQARIASTNNALRRRIHSKKCFKECCPEAHRLSRARKLVGASVNTLNPHFCLTNGDDLTTKVRSAARSRSAAC